jgi:5-methyltetrahydrofolate--homocysteine methyltransferase
MADILKAIAQGVEKGDDKKVVELVTQAVKSGIPALQVLDKGLVPGIQALGRCFKEGTAYLPEVLIATRAMNRGVEVLKPHLANVKVQSKGTVVIGTVEGDMHDIGKNLVRLMLESNGFTVDDLGNDVLPDTFVSAVKSKQVDIVAMSALLTMTMTNMPRVIEALKQAGLRDKVKIMIGGAPITREFANEIGAEGFAEDCVSAVDEALKLVKK